MASVDIVDVYKNYGAAHILHGINLLANDGEFVTLVGPSGCGKSTLLRMIAGLESVTGGEIRVGDIVVNEVAPKDRDIAMVFQNYALYPHMTVADNMGFSLKIRGENPDVIKKRVSEVAAILGLEPMLARQPRHLSGGQRQRVAMGRAIIRQPKVFLFDEPLSNLDAKLRVAMRAEIKELQQRLRTTMIYVTHDQAEAMTMADKIVVMNDGNIEQAGSPLELYDRPINTFVAGFIGSPSMNLIRGRIIQRDGLAFETEESALVALDRNVFVGATPGQSCTLGIRPEHIRPGTHGIPAKVVVVEQLGSESQIIARFAGHQITCVVRERIALNPGDTIALEVETDKLHLFDGSSGIRLPTQ
ncbi:ABC transporter ATP-binding protein [Leptospira interrogans]